MMTEYTTETREDKKGLTPYQQRDILLRGCQDEVGEYRTMARLSQQWTFAVFLMLMCYVTRGSVMAAEGKYISLPPVSVATDGQPLERLLQQRRSVRTFNKAPLSLAELGQLLWAAQGITHPQGLRTAPSAGALYPLELYVVAGAVEGLPSAVYRYLPKGHRLLQTTPGDRRRALAGTTFDQPWLADAAVVIVFTAIYARTTRKYAERGVRYVHMEVGHAAQNLFLQAEAQALGSVVMGAFRDGEVSKLLDLPADTEPLLLMPVGR